MGYNIAPWSKEALGHPITRQEFMDNPEYQDAIAAHRVMKYLKDYTPKQVASIWFSGGHNTPGYKTDVNGKTVSDYKIDVMNNYQLTQAK